MLSASLIGSRRMLCLMVREINSLAFFPGGRTCEREALTIGGNGPRDSQMGVPGAKL